MATTYTWDCKTVDVYPTNQEETDVVYNVHWIVTGTSSELDPQGVAYSSGGVSAHRHYLLTTSQTSFHSLT